MIETVYIDQINNTDALVLAIEAHYELMKAGLSNPMQMVGWDNSAILARTEGHLRTGTIMIPAGVITFEHAKWQKRVYIQLGYVKPEYRRQGIYRAMWDELVRKARELNAKQIMGVVSAQNHDMLAAAKSLGRYQHSINLAFDL